MTAFSRFWSTVRRFTIINDKPWMAILQPDKELPPLTAQRVLRYALFLQGFDFNVRFQKTQEHQYSDALSRY